jgi:hypothetical protein
LRQDFSDDGGQQLAGLALDALGAQHQRHAGGHVRPRIVQHRAQRLRRRHRQHAVGLRQRLRQVGRRLDAGVKDDARQVARILAAADRRHRFAVARPQPDGMPGAQHGQRQRRAPGAAAQHGDAVFFARAHALAPRLPAPTTGAET